MKSVTVRQAKYFMDRIKRNDLPFLKLKEHEIFDKVLEAIEENGFYEKIWQQVEEEARRIIKEVEPKAKEVMEKIAEVNKKISETKAAEDKEPLEAEMKSLWEEYDKLYKDAQGELDKFKVKLIVEDNRGVKIMDISDSEYDLVNKVINWNINEAPKEDVSKKFESEVEDVTPEETTEEVEK